MPDSTRFNSVNVSSPFSSSQRLPVLGSKSKPKLLRCP
jgi:hypothetical protein